MKTAYITANMPVYRFPSVRSITVNDTVCQSKQREEKHHCFTTVSVLTQKFCTLITQVEYFLF